MNKWNKIVLKANEAQSNTIILLGINLVFILLNRAIEALLLSQNHYFDGIISDVFLGLIFDLISLSFIVVVIFIFHVLLPTTWTRGLRIVILSASILFHLFHLPILYFYASTLTTLDRLLFAHTYEELVFTIKTAGMSFNMAFIVAIIYILFFVLTVWVFFKYPLFVRFRKPIKWIVPIIAIGCFWITPGFFGTHSHQSINIQNNKSLYFYEDAIKYFSHKTFYRSGFYDIYANAKEYQQYFNNHKYVSIKYPFLNIRTSDNPWGNYFIKSEEPPSIVMIIIEGLNNDFLLPKDGVILMPFLDSLKNSSLYWDHFLGTGERSYAVLPSMIGSLPHGEIGFSMLGDMPLHLSLINQLKPHGYKTSFFYGQGGYFHNKNNYLFRNNIDLFADRENFDESFEKIIDAGSNYFWGYHDQDLFQNYFMLTEQDNTCRRLDVFFTGTMHSPFAIANEEHYNSRYDQIINNADLSLKQIAYYENYKRYLRTLLFTDDALKQFFENFSKKKCFENTIFIITGDHPMTEVLVANPLKKYHTSLIVYSPMLTNKKTISSVAGQFEVLPSLMNLLEQNFNLNFGKYSHMFGLPTDTSCVFQSQAIIPFMRGNRLVNELLFKNYFLSDDILYAVKPDFEIEKIDNQEVKDSMQMMLRSYNKVNNDMVREARLIPDSVFFSHANLKSLVNLNFTSALKISPNRKYYNLSFINLASLPNNKLFVFVRGETTGKKSDTMPLLVFEQRDENDSILKWDSMGLNLKQKSKSHGASKFFNQYFSVEAEESSTQKTQLRIYFINEKASSITIKQLELKVFSTGY